MLFPQMQDNALSSIFACVPALLNSDNALSEFAEENYECVYNRLSIVMDDNHGGGEQWDNCVVRVYVCVDDNDYLCVALSICGDHDQGQYNEYVVYSDGHAVRTFDGDWSNHNQSQEIESIESYSKWLEDRGMVAA